MFDRAQQNNELRRVMDACLPGLEKRPDFDRDVLRQVRGEVKVKRKLSVGFVLTMILILITVTALAITAIQALHEKAIQQEAESGLIREWSADEKVEFVDEMVEAGIELNEAQIQSLHSDALSEEEKDTLAMQIMTGYYPTVDSVLTATDILSSEYGRYGTWPLELQAWYSETLKENGGSSDRWNVLPGDDAISEEQALCNAKGMLTEIYNYSQEEADTMFMERFFREVDVEGRSQSQWYFQFYPDINENEFYFVSLEPNGQYIQSGSTFTDETEGALLGQMYSDLRRSGKLKTVEDFASYAETVAPLINDAIARGVEDISPWAVYFASIPYALPIEADITQEEAIQIADAAVTSYTGWTLEEIYHYYVPSISFRVYDEDNFEWRLGYHLPVGGALNGYEDAYERFHAGEIPFCIIVRMNSRTREVFEVSESYNQNANRFGE